ncbi:hypothetical protein [Moorena sp. SIO4G3]|nr:hypothetical protein [Moorena sp. SIO4G3]
MKSEGKHMRTYHRLEACSTHATRTAVSPQWSVVSLWLKADS